MRITVFAHGTRGDVWPLVALSARLTELDHDVVVATTEEFRPIVEAAGARFAPVPVSLTDFLASADGRAMLRAGGLRLLRAVQRLYDEHRDAIDDAFESASRAAEAVVSMHLTMDRAQAVADALCVPAVNVFPFPLTPTREFTSPVLGRARRVPGRVALAGHRLVHAVWTRAGAGGLAGFRHRLGVAPNSVPTIERQDHDRGLTLNAYSRHVCPRAADWGTNQAVTGYFQLPRRVREAVGETLPPALAEWMSSGPPPVFLGFGSMPATDTARFAADAFATLRLLGLRAVIDAEWRVDAPDGVRFARGVDHDRLLPLCAAAVHHGGAGTLGASLRAGLPTMVCSVWAEQPWWGSRVERLGVGVHRPFRGLDRTTLQEGVGALLSPSIRERAARLGEAIRAEGDGSETAARLLDDWLVTAEPTPRGRGRG